MLSISHAAAPRASAGYVLPGQNRILRLCRGNNLRAISPFLPSRILPPCPRQKAFSPPGCTGLSAEFEKKLPATEGRENAGIRTVPLPCPDTGPTPDLANTFPLPAQPHPRPRLPSLSREEETESHPRRNTPPYGRYKFRVFYRLFLTLGENTLDYLSRINK